MRRGKRRQVVTPPSPVSGSYSGRLPDRDSSLAVMGKTRENFSGHPGKTPQRASQVRYKPAHPEKRMPPACERWAGSSTGSVVLSRKTAKAAWSSITRARGRACIEEGEGNSHGKEE